MQEHLDRLVAAFHRLPANPKERTMITRRLHHLCQLPAVVLTIFCAMFVATLPGNAATLLWTNAAADNAAANAANWYDVDLGTFGHSPAGTDNILLDGAHVSGNGTSANLNWGASATHSVANWTQQNYASTVTFDITYNNVNTNGFNVFTVSNDAQLQTGIWTHSANGLGYNAANPDRYRLRIDIGNDFTVGTGGTISATNKGYLLNAPGFNGGGTHGGRGSGTGNTTQPYGSIFEPVRHGQGAGTSGGSGNVDGGGSIYLTVGAQSTIDGTIVATSQYGASPSFIRAGAGGSIYLSTGSLSGAATGSFDVSGGNSTGGSNTGNGGGGRIAIRLNDSLADFSGFNGTWTARGGTGSENFTVQSAAGSIYLRDGNQSAGQGNLRIDFGHRYGDLADDHGFRFTTEDLSQVSVELARQAKLDLNASKTVGSLAGDATSNAVLATSQTLTVGGLGTNTTYSGSLMGAGHLLKIGSGTLTLAGHSYTHAGTVTVTDGTLVVDGGLVAGAVKNGNTVNNSKVVSGVDTTGLVVGQPLSGTGIRAGSFISSIDSPTQITLSQTASATGTGVGLTFEAGAGLTGSVVVSSGASLAGSGVIDSGVTIGGSLRPGNSIGTLTVADDVTWNAGDAWVFELGIAGASLATPGSADLLLVGGDFLKGSGSDFVFDFAGGGQLGWYKLVDWDGVTDFVEADFSAINLAISKSLFVLDSTTSALYLQIIPEPTTAALLGLAGLAGLRRRTRIRA